VLAGEHASCASQVAYDGALLNTLSPAEQATRRVVLEQSPTLSAEFCVSELVELGAPLELALSDLVWIKAMLLDAFGLAHCEQEAVSALSGGQRHRAHLARVLMQLKANTTLGHRCALFLDEPTASLDIAHQISVLKHAKQLADSGIAVLIVLHDLNLAAAFADRVLMLKDGRAHSDGAPQDVLTNTALSDVYETPIFVQPSASGQLVIQPAL
jgi:iron complex transport system ATP-binding protein